MVNKIVWFAMGLTLFLLCSCVGADVLHEGIEGYNADFSTYVEPDETADYEEIDETVNEITNEMTVTSPVAISVPEPHFPQDEPPAVDPLCPRNRCAPVCVMLYIDGEYIPRCDIHRKYTFFFYCDISRWMDG